MKAAFPYLTSFSGIVLAASLGAATTQSPVQDPLPDFSGVRLQAYNWRAPMSPSAWGEPKLGGYDWRADHASVSSGKLLLSVSERASGQVQTNSAAFSTAAHWEVDVTVPEMRDGLVAAPLWTFNDDTKDEIDFEVIGRKGLDLTIWSKVNGKHTSVWSKRVIEGDLSGRRYRLGVAYNAGQWVRYYVDGRMVAEVTPSDAPLGFPTTPQKPYFDLWVTNGLDPAWAGRWTPLSRGERLTMVLHGYRAQPIGS